MRTLSVALILTLNLLTMPSLASEDCAAIISRRCELCHYKTRICHNLGKKSKSDWKRTIKNMVRYGAQITTDEKKSLIQCLADAEPGADFACKNK